MLVDGLLFLYLFLLTIFLSRFNREIVQIRTESEKRNSLLKGLEETLIATIRALQKLMRENEQTKG